jgi:hypothetical protein
MKINIENPKRIEYFVSKSVTSWRIEYIGQGDLGNDIYYYNLIHKENPKIVIHIEIYYQTQQGDKMAKEGKLDNEWVKIRLIYPLKKDVIKFIRVEEFKDMRRVFNTLHDGARRLMQ